MRAIEEAGNTLYTCGFCASAWLDSHACRQLLDIGLGPGTHNELLRQDSVPTQPQDGVGYRDAKRRACPICGESLVEAAPMQAGIVVDVCATHGTYFDQGELRAFANIITLANEQAAEHATLQKVVDDGIAESRHWFTRAFDSFLASIGDSMDEAARRNAQRPWWLQ